MSENELQVVARDRALIVTINREPRRNALSRSLLDAFAKLKRNWRNTPDLRAIVLTGAGDQAFCAGADLKERQSMSTSDVRDQLGLYRTSLGWLSDCEVPVVAAINGVALGGGLELALLADLRVCVPDASFGLPETSLAIIPGAGGTQRLPRLIGTARAMEMILLARRLTARQALDFGLVNHIVDAGTDLLEATLAWLEPILEGSPVAQRAAVAAVRRASSISLAEGLVYEQQQYERCLTSDDRLEALQAFAEKRPPRFGGHG